jgi:hypothetical protein
MTDDLCLTKSGAISYHDYGFMGKLSKPYSLDELQKLLEKLIAVR